MLLEIILLLIAIPAGFILSHLTRDELKVGRKWFLSIMVLSIILAVYFSLISSQELAYTLGFILITTSISYIKSFDRKWTRKRA